jgi:hypothetical protein
MQPAPVMAVGDPFADLWGMISNSPSAGNNYTHKILLRNRCQSLSIPTPLDEFFPKLGSSQQRHVGYLSFEPAWVIVQRSVGRRETVKYLEHVKRLLKPGITTLEQCSHFPLTKELLDPARPLLGLHKCVYLVECPIRYYLCPTLAIDVIDILS